MFLSMSILWQLQNRMFWPIKGLHSTSSSNLPHLTKMFERTLSYLNTFFTNSQLTVHMHELSYINVSTFYIPFIRRIKHEKVSNFLYLFVIS